MGFSVFFIWDQKTGGFFDSDWSVYQQTLNAIGQTTETSFGDLSENAMNLSVNILTQDYGFNVLDALLFLDWASQSDKDLYKALYALRHHSGERRMERIELSPSALSPGVKAAYDKLIAKQQAKLEQQRKVYESIKDKDIYEG